MQLIVCLDNQRGMCFNKRRQSRDRMVTEKICSIVRDKQLHVPVYSAALFAQSEISLSVSEDYLKEATESDGIAFVERDSVASFADDVNKLYVFLWNRDYPSDMKFPMDAFAGKLSKREVCEFPGSSHETITLEVYEK
ncbi:MAG: ribonuclease Z [Oscillospiraceae bacterium]|nr:ribonuclease Z [Oscillospiraceae bacterium]